MPRIQADTVKNLFYLINQQRARLFVFTVVITLTSLFEALGIGTLYPILNIFNSDEKRSVYAKLINNILPFDIGLEQIVPVLFLSVIIFFIARGIFIVLSYYAQFKLSQGLTSKWQNDIFSSYMGQDYDYFIKHRAGDLLQKQMVHTENAGNAIVYTCQIARNIFTVVLLFAMLFFVSVKWALSLIAVSAVSMVIVYAVSRIKVYADSRVHAELQKESYSLAAEVISGIRQVKAFLAEDFFKKRFCQAVCEKARIYTRNATISCMPTPVMQTLVVLAILLVLFAASLAKENAGSIFAAIAIFGGASYRIMTSMSGINSGFIQIASLLPSINIVSGLLCLARPREDMPAIKCFKKGISFSNTGFAYGQSGFRLSGINLELEKGKFYGIVGPSGSGKSTLIDLLIGFYGYDTGSIRIDGQDMRDFDIRSWRRMIGLISQDTFIFNGTIADNISFAVEAGAVEKSAIISSAKAADIHDFIAGLPDGYDTLVGERGLTLSGGQRQRLAIARAVYRDPEVYIFDEATSSLDTYSEKKIQEAIEGLSRSKTVICVSHRLSTVINADSIIVLDAGRVVETGSHNELLSKGGFYARLYRHQHGEEKNNQYP
ncbi:MAG: ABC transporter ATP-binding protein [Candidatus Omnitrophica bacterium]|nr:ABC transporter ATP-binding protein [Candidatus Omnitrophota bacterium]